MAVEFFQTHSGRRFFEHTLPDIARQLKRIADAMESPKPEPVAVQGDMANTRDVAAVQAALVHVRKSYPEICQVLYTLDGSWLYLTADGDGGVRFDVDFDTGPLEVALTSIVSFPAAFALNSEA